MLIYNNKNMQVRFNLILCVQGYILLYKAIQPCITKFGIQSYLNTNIPNWSVRTGQIVHLCISEILLTLFLQYNNTRYNTPPPLPKHLSRIYQFHLTLLLVCHLNLSDPPFHDLVFTGCHSQQI